MVSLHAPLSMNALYKEPSSYKEASNDPILVEAMNRQMNALQSDGTWVETNLPSNKKAISCRWFIKLNSNLMVLLNGLKLDLL